MKKAIKLFLSLSIFFSSTLSAYAHGDHVVDGKLTFMHFFSDPHHLTLVILGGVVIYIVGLLGVKFLNKFYK